ncbi:hypothetical protein [Streptomyces sp. KL118A]|uniref:hypothetical protein n=1 Tax=Streptomyces sp. KL118A TaxID=3045153 RepID=UPI00278C230A|nr:hypothetical protein [Streptomyces sp. KL118A]
MADNAALLGVISAVSGAAIGGISAIVGPLLLHRRGQERENRDRTNEAREAEVSRVVRIRSSTRKWHQILEDTYQDLKDDRTVSLDRFDEVINQVKEEATAALDEALYDGLWVFGGGRLAPEQFEGEGYSPPGLSGLDDDPPPPPPSLRSSPMPGYGYPSSPNSPLPPLGYGYPSPSMRPEGLEVDEPQFLDALASATRLIRKSVAAGGIDNPHTDAVILGALGRVTFARQRLATELFNRIEGIMGDQIRIF